MSPGVRLVEPDLDKNEDLFYVEGDVDYAIPSINKNKEDLLYNLNHWHKISPSSSLRDSFLCISSLYNQLHQAKIRIKKSLKVLKSKSRINSISISRESANISIINSSIHDVLDLKGKFIKHSLLNKTKFPTVQEDVNLELETCFDQSINQSINQSGQKIINSQDIYRLAGLSTLVSCRSAWKSLLTKLNGDIVPRSELRMVNLNYLTLFLKIFDDSLKVVEREDFYITFNQLRFRIQNPSIVVAEEGSIEYVHLYCEDIDDFTIFDIITQMSLTQKSGLLTLNTKEHFKVYLLQYTAEIQNIWRFVNVVLASIASGGNIPSNRTQEMNVLKLIYSEFAKPEPFPTIPIEITNFSIHEIPASYNNSLNSVRRINVKILKKDEILIQGTELSRCHFDNLFMETLKKVTVALLPPATHILVAMVNSVYGKAGKHVSDLPVFYCRTGKGYSVKHEINCIVDTVKARLAEKNIRVVCFAADTAFHNILSVQNHSGTLSNLIGLKFEERKKWKQNFNVTLNELLKEIFFSLNYNPPLDSLSCNPNFIFTFFPHLCFKCKLLTCH